MSESTSQLKIGAALDGSFEQTTTTVKRKLNELGTAATSTGKSLAGMGDGTESASKKVESATRSIEGQIQRLTAKFESGEKGSRKFYESLANQRGVNIQALDPLLTKLDAAKAKFEATTRASKETSASFGGLGTAAGFAARAFAALGIAASLKQFISMADASTNLASRLSLVTTSTGQLLDLQGKLFTVAQDARVSFVDLAGTYAQLARSTKELGVSQTSLLGVVKTISQAVTISGGSAQSAQAALMQLSQGFASGALRGEELNSVLEQTPRLAQAIAEGLGVSIGKLREMGKAGELTSEAVLGALENAASSVSSEFGKMALTVDQASTQAGNSALKLVGVIDKITGASAVAAAGVSRLSAGMDSLATDIQRMSATSNLSDFFFLAFQNEKTLNLELVTTQDELANVNKLLAKTPSNIYAMSAKADIESYIQKIIEAQNRLDVLSGKGVARDPRDQSGFTSRGDSAAAEAKRQAQLNEDLNSFRLKSSNVPASYIKDMQEIIRLNQEGKLVGDEYTKAIKAQQNALLKAADTSTKVKKTKDESAAAIKAEISDIARGVALYEDLISKSNGFTSNYAEQLQALSFAASKGALSIAEVAEATALLNAQQPGAVAAGRALKDASESAGKYIDALNKSADGIGAQLQKLQDEEQALQLSASAHITLAEAIEEVEIARLRETQAQELSYGNESAAQAIQREIDLRRTLAKSIVSKDVREAGIKAADDMREAQKKAAEESGKYWEDALMRAFESGKGFFQSLWDTIKNTLKTQVLKVVIQGSMGALGIGAAGAASAGSGGFMGLAGTASTISNLYSGVSSLVTVGAQTLAGTMSAANALGTIAANATGTGITGLLATNGAFGTAAAGTASATAGGIMSGASAALAAIPVWGWVALGVAAIASYVGGRGETRSGATYTTGADGKAFYSEGPSGGEIAGDAARALFDSTKNSIQDTLKLVGSSASVTGFVAGLESSKNGKGFAFAGGLVDGAAFGEDKGRSGGQFGFGDMNNEQAMAAYIMNLKQATLQALQAATDIPKLLSDQLVGIDIAALDTAGLDNLVAAIGGTISAVNGFVDQINTGGIKELHDIGFAAAAGLIAASGGLENLTANLSSYYTNFYTTEEQRAQTIKNINAATAGSGLDAAASTRDQFRSIVESQDLATESGQKMYAALLGVSGAFAGLVPVLDSATQALQSGLSDYVSGFLSAGQQLELKQAEMDSQFGRLKLVTPKSAADFVSLVDGLKAGGAASSETLGRVLALSGGMLDLADATDAAIASLSGSADDAMSALTRAVDAQKKIYQVQVDAASAAVTEIQSIFNTLDSAITTLYGQVASAQSASAGRAFIANALSNAQSTGYLPDSKDLASAVSAALSDSTVYASQAESEYQRLVLAGSMSKLKDLSLYQLTTAEKQLKAAESQIALLDDTLVLAQQQLDAANGINTSVLSVAAALIEFNASIQALAAAQASVRAASTGVSVNAGTVGTGSTGGFDFGYNASPSGSFNTGGISVADSDSANLQAAKALYLSATGGVDSGVYASAMAGIGGNIGALSWDDSTGIEGLRAQYGFAVGINRVPFDMTARIHEGEAVVPAALNPFNPNAKINGMGGNTDRLEALVEGLTKEVQRLQSIVNDGNTHARRTADTLDNVTEGGSNMRTTAA